MVVSFLGPSENRTLGWYQDQYENSGSPSRPEAVRPHPRSDFSGPSEGRRQLLSTSHPSPSLWLLRHLNSQHAAFALSIMHHLLGLRFRLVFTLRRRFPLPLGTFPGNFRSPYPCQHCPIPRPLRRKTSQDGTHKSPIELDLCRWVEYTNFH